MTEASAAQAENQATQADMIERMLEALPEDRQSAVDRLTRAALTGYVQGVRDGLRAAGHE